MLSTHTHTRASAQSSLLWQTVDLRQSTWNYVDNKMYRMSDIFVSQSKNMTGVYLVCPLSIIAHIFYLESNLRQFPQFRPFQTPGMRIWDTMSQTCIKWTIVGSKISLMIMAGFCFHTYKTSFIHISSLDLLQQCLTVQCDVGLAWAWHRLDRGSGSDSDDDRGRRGGDNWLVTF